MVIDTDFAEFIDDHRDAAAVIGGKDSIEQGGFAGAEKAGEHSHRHSLIVRVGHAVMIPVVSKK